MLLLPLSHFGRALLHILSLRNAHDSRASETFVIFEGGSNSTKRGPPSPSADTCPGPAPRLGRGRGGSYSPAAGPKLSAEQQRRRRRRRRLIRLGPLVCKRCALGTPPRPRPVSRSSQEASSILAHLTSKTLQKQQHLHTGSIYIPPEHRNANLVCVHRLEPLLLELHQKNSEIFYWGDRR